VTRGSASPSSTSWSKGRRAVAIIPAAVGADADADANADADADTNADADADADADANADADADADANADAGVIVVVVPPAIPPPVAAVEGVDCLRRTTTIPARPGIISSCLELWRMVMSRVKTGYLFRFGKLVCGLKKRREKKVFVQQKTLDKKWNGFRPEWDKKNLGRNFVCFSTWNSWMKTATKSCITNQWKKYPNDRLLVQNLHTTKRGKNKKTLSFICMDRP
jgi:hypothetical protein